MTQPKTLMQIAGAAPFLPAWSDAALLLIDHQREYTDGGVPLAGAHAAVEEISRLLALARDAGAPVFHIVHHGRAGSALFDPQREFVQIIPGLEPAGDERVIVKGLPNSFAGTSLHQQLQDSGRKELVICGFATHICISATTRAALDLGYRNAVVAAACATRDLPSPLGGVVPAQQVHEATLAALNDRFATVVKDSSVWN